MSLDFRFQISDFRFSRDLIDRRRCIASRLLSVRALGAGLLTSPKPPTVGLHEVGSGLAIQETLRSSVCGVGRPTHSADIPQSAIRNPNSPRSGISLIEILISMFVMLFGLMGVAAIFPVGNHYVVEGEKYDLGSGLAQNAFEELQARGILRPEFWLYTDPPPSYTAAPPPSNASTYNVRWVIEQTGGNTGGFVFQISANANDPHPGHAFVIDPMATPAALPSPANRWAFPMPGFVNNPWLGVSVGLGLPGNQWPVRRLTLPVPDPTGTFSSISMTTPVAETIFRLRDDLSVSQPEEDDHPSVQTWDIDNNGSPTDPNDDRLLRRQYKGDYSWLATIVPTTSDALTALQPADDGYGHYPCEVSIVVFRKRDNTPSAESERLIEARLDIGGELILYAVGNSPTEQQIVDAAVDGIRPGQWVCLMGVNQTTGDFVMKWYRLLSLDDDSELDRISLDGSTTLEDVYLRRAMLKGPDWPSNSVYNLRAAILPDVISVATKEMRMEE